MAPPWNFKVEELPWYMWPYYIPETVNASDKPCAFSVTIEVEMPSAVVDMDCPTHVVKWERGTVVGQASASFWKSTEPIMGKDLVLRIKQEKPHEPNVQVEVAPDSSGVAMVRDGAGTYRNYFPSGLLWLNGRN